MTYSPDLQMLTGCRLLEIGRAADLVWWIFSDDQGICYSLHTQCAWRMLSGGRMILSREYIYCTNDESGENWFDDRLGEINQAILPRHVMSVRVGDLNDVTLLLDDELKVEIFADQPIQHEQWRIFVKGDPSPHLVAYADHVEEQ